MAKPAARILFLEVALAVGAVVIVARSFVVQIVQHRIWAAKLEARRETDRPIRARRGRIYDRNGNPLAVSAEQFRVSISLNELKDTADLQARLPDALGVPKPRVDAEFRKRYATFNGPFTAEQVQSIRTVRGVHLTPLYDRVYPMAPVADRILGRLDPESGGVEGMERALDTLLQGRAGREHFILDREGSALPAPGAPLLPPVAGHDVYLTLDSDLQGIVEGALRRTVTSTGASGGEVVIMDVATGELLALASVHRDSLSHNLVSTASALLEPNEPGSTSKLFTVAALLRRGGADTMPVDGEGGTWEMQIGRATRTIHDEHKLTGPVNLAGTVKYSSNIAISKFSLRLQPEEQYQAIRNFGFGVPPATGYPGEAAGTLTRPSEWANPKYSQPSLGQGYEWEATAVQLAAGYGAIANRGVLMAPALVREVHDEQGRVTWRHRADTVRRAIPDSIARTLVEYLKLAVDSGGTGTKAQLDNMANRVAGKTGTARRLHGGYRSSFVALFPADQPQAIVYVMIDRATNGQIFGGDVAAPVVPAILKQALVLSKSPFDRSRLMTTVPMAPVRRAPLAETAPIRTVAFPVAAATKPSATADVPSVNGLGVRDAIVQIERAGFGVRLVGRARVRSTVPAAGGSWPRGAIVTLYADSLP